MARLVLAMPQMFATPPPLLTPLETRDEVEENAPTVGEDRVEASTIGNSGQVVTQSHRFTKLEVLTLVCGCFFGIFPDQDIAKRTQPQIGASNRKAARRGSKSDMIQFPYFTAVRMFSAPGNMGRMVVLKGQKIRCLLQYFMRVVPRVISDRASMLSEVIDFTRVSVNLPSAQGPIPSDQPPQELLKLIATVTDCSNTVDQAQTNGEVLSSLRLYPAQCVSDTLIEDLDEHLQIDFANKFAGGGVLNAGCVQEEIRFLLSPELLVSCLVFAKLEPHEAFVIHGTERYSAYQGYGGSFVYGGNFEDTIRMKVLSDGSLRRECVIVGIDATDYGSSRVDRQYTRGHVWRDLVKAYVGFAYPDAHDEHRCWPVATGNWGCGVFQGDRELKFMIQWLAASLRRRELVYVLFERDLDLQTKVNPLLTLATSPKAREWDRQSGGLLQWFVAFLFDELNADREMRREQSVLGRAAASLERTLSALNLAGGKQKQECSKQAAGSPPGSPLIAAENNQEPLAIVRHPDQADKEGSAGLKKKPKTTKGELHQKTMQDFFSPK
ncbi:unnamed protein product [Phytophthora lilii]|uniref:poly(ADP-ribose) glycohydrolase n=1 Tax=Phytophthora lilii TaxID=2077276 RepID=A0A9W6TUY6_9STRA|nr:unnamed protein product [Phytophthora lilii]